MWASSLGLHFTPPRGLLVRHSNSKYFTWRWQAKMKCRHPIIVHCQWQRRKTCRWNYIVSRRSTRRLILLYHQRSVIAGGSSAYNHGLPCPSWLMFNWFGWCCNCSLIGKAGIAFLTRQQRMKGYRQWAWEGQLEGERRRGSEGMHDFAWLTHFIRPLPKHSFNLFLKLIILCKKYLRKFLTKFL